MALAKLVNHLRNQNYLQRYLHVSSPEAYGTCVGRVTEESPLNPSTPYAESKAAADMLLATFHRQFGFPLLTVRATNVYGAGGLIFVQDHSPVGNLRQNGQKDPTARRREGGQVVHSHP